jgi:hypothetical protein
MPDGFFSDLLCHTNTMRLTCIRALIRNNGFPRDADITYQCVEGVVTDGLLPPTAPLVAPARTDVNGIWSSAERPMNLFRLRLNGS